MSVPITINDGRPTPTVVRIDTIVIKNACNKKYGRENLPTPEGGESEYIELPYVELVLRGAIPLLDENGDQRVTSDFGQPMYEDTGHIASLKFSSLEEMAPFIATIWEPLMAAGYAKVSDKLADLKFSILW